MPKERAMPTAVVTSKGQITIPKPAKPVSVEDMNRAVRRRVVRQQATR